MKVRVYQNKEQCGNAAAVLFAAQILKKANTVLGLATGSTPIPVYQALIRMYKEGTVDFSACRSFNLDEYVNLPVDHACSYHTFMKEELFDHINVPANAIRVPDGNAEDPASFCKAYDAEIAAAGGIDIQLLGIGRNGHIGFNEPSDHFVPGCHVVDLTASTIAANARFFDSENDVPRQAISLGIENILSAKSIVLLAFGKEKAEAVRAMLQDPITPQVPASILRTHPDVTLILDEDAASLL